MTGAGSGRGLNDTDKGLGPHRITIYNRESKDPRNSYRQTLPVVPTQTQSHKTRGVRMVGRNGQDVGRGWEEEASEWKSREGWRRESLSPRVLPLTIPHTCTVTAVAEISSFLLYSQTRHLVLRRAGMATGSTGTLGPRVCSDRLRSVSECRLDNQICVWIMIKDNLLRYALLHSFILHDNRARSIVLTAGQSTLLYCI